VSASQWLQLLTEARSMPVEVKPSLEINGPEISAGNAQLSPKVDTACLQAIGSTSHTPTKILTLAGPFAGTAGWLFMRVCWVAEVLEAWASKSSRREQLEAAVTKKFGSRVAGWLPSLIAAAYCILAAACVVPLFWAHFLHPIAPLFFLLVISYIAVRFGSLAGIIGTLGAAAIFALFLFEPRLTFAIDSAAERNRLISMVIVGLLMSELLGRRKPPVVYKR
jgi:hypothetical protein